MKKLLSVFLAIVFAFSSVAIIAYAGEDALNAYIIQKDIIPTGKESAERKIDAFGANGEYYFFIPSSIDVRRALFVVDGEAYADGVKITEATTVFDVFGSGTFGPTEAELTVDGKKYNVNAVFGSEIANIFIETESGSLDAIHADKSHEESGLIEIVCGDGTMAYDGVLETIKGRGNSTWKMEKKPYNIKLDKKTDLFGMGKSKKWSLIANHTDLSLIRNAYVYYAALYAGIEYTPKCMPCDVYINNEYQGQYLLTTRVEVDETRVDIENLEDANEEANPDIDIEEDCSIGGYYGRYAGLLEGTSKWVNMPNEPDDVTGGYILEMEIANRYVDEVSGFVSNMGQPFIMKSPEYASKGEIDYISAYYQDFEDAVISADGKNAEGKHYSEYIDVESFAEYYVFNEWTSNMDCGLTSTYLYKPANDVLYAGPVWDYDIALGNNDIARYGCDYTNPNEFTVCFGRQYRNTIFEGRDVDHVPTLFNVLCQKQEFVDEAKKVWNSKIKHGVVLANQAMPIYADMIEDSAVMNAIRWNLFGTYDIDEIVKAYKAETGKACNFASVRKGFIDNNIGTIQVQNVEISFFDKITMKVCTFINNLFEDFIVTFRLVNLF